MHNSYVTRNCKTQVNGVKHSCYRFVAMDNGVDYEMDREGLFDDESPLQRIVRINRIHEDFQRAVAV